MSGILLSIKKNVHFMTDWAFVRKRKSDKLALLEQDLN